jgi:23S rRNA pseudouridine1911/1915/1917 synthase
MKSLFPVVFEDQHLLVVNKPAGLVCHPTKGDEYSSLVGRVRLYLGRPGHLVNRLDRETSGVVFIAKTPEAARDLGRSWESRQVEKTYLAIVHGQVTTEIGCIQEPLGKDESAQVAIKDCVRADGAAAVTRYRRRKHFRRFQGDFSLLEVMPETGRKHQIRLHLAHVGHPIVGDKLYGGDEMLYLDFVKDRLTAEQRARLILPNQALHALRVTLPPGTVWETFQAEPEHGFKEFAGMDDHSWRDGSVGFSATIS